MGLAWIGWWLAAAVAWAQLPLTSLTYEVEVAGPLAEVVVHQTFRNDSDEFVEATYLFPLHPDAAVDGVDIHIEDRLIRAVIRETADARATYERAVSEGQLAALTEQRSTDLFAQQVGNIPPHTEVVVELRLVQPVDRASGWWELVLPLSHTPRFALVDDPSLDTEWHEADSDDAPLVEVDIHAVTGVPIREAHSPSHDMDVQLWGPELRASVAGIAPGRDLVLTWRTATDEPVVGFLVAGDHGLLTLEPPRSSRFEERVPREIVWVVDQSGSMSGAPLGVVKQAMLAALEHLDERDSFTVLGFSGRLRAWSQGPVPATPDNRRRAAEFVTELVAGGGTRLDQAVTAALDLPGDLGRQRIVVFVTDGAVAFEESVLQQIVDVGTDATLVTVGIGSSPNRSLLDELADLGGGTSVYLPLDGDPDASMSELMEALDRPVMTGVTLDWSGWEPEEMWPRRLPDLRTDEPTYVVVRLGGQDGGPVWLEGQVGPDRVQRVLYPQFVPTSRALRSTFGHHKVEDLYRRHRRGLVADVGAEVLATALEYEIVTPLTSFVAVEHDTTRRALAELDRFRAFSLVPQGVEGAVYTESSSRSSVLTKDFIEHVPAGRSYQTAVQIIPGRAGGPSLGLGATHETTFLLDGANITDPITGTFSVNFNFDAIEEIEVLMGAFMPEQPGTTGGVVRVTSRSGTNNLQSDVGADHARGVGSELSSSRVAGFVSGPVVRDKAWVFTSVGYDQSSIPGRDFEGYSGFGKVTVHPTTEHRLSASANRDLADVEGTGEAVRQGSSLGQVRWQWFLAPQVNVDAVASSQALAVGDDDRYRHSAQVALSALSVTDPVGGSHDAKVGADVERLGWDLVSTVGWVPPELQLAGGTRAGAFAQDSWSASPGVTVNGGARVDVAQGAAYVGPRLYGAWDPFQDQKTKLALGAGRFYGQLSLPILAIAPEEGLPRMDEVMAVVERELVEDLALGADAALRWRTGLPSLEGDRLDRRTFVTRLYMRKVMSRRWTGQVSWAWTHLIGEPEGTLLDSSGLEAFAHSGDASLLWHLPIDPWTTQLGMWGAVYADPLGTLAPGPGSNGVAITERWSAGVRLQQRVDVRKGRLTLHVEAGTLALLAEPPDLRGLLVTQAALPELAGFEGTRLEGGLRYGF